MKKLLFSVSPLSTPGALGALVLRVFFGLFMLVGHGWGKLVNFEAVSERFIPFLGLPQPIPLGLAVFAEVFCAALVTVGLFTRAALIPLIVTMGVAAFVFHAGDPLFMPQPPDKSMEPALMYLAAYVGLFLTGPGKFSLDALFRK